MRVKLNKGKQKELIRKIKNINNFTWQQFSQYLNVKEGALREWFKETNLLPYEVYKKLDSQQKYSDYIEDFKENNWRRSKGGLSSKGSLKKIKIPNESSELAEFIGIILGDGNIHSFVKGKKIRIYSVRIAGDYKKEKEYHTKYVAPLGEKLFGLKGRVQVTSKDKARFVCFYGKALVNYLNDSGLKSGNKLINQNTIPKWVYKNNNFLKACLRGLIDTDGSIFRMSKKDPHLLRINFKNLNKTLLEDVRTSFAKLGFHPSNIITGNTIYLSRKSDIENYIKQIGFSNQKHIKRLQSFNSPVV